MSFVSKLVVFLFGINLLLTDHCIALENFAHQIPSYSQASQDRFVYSLLYEILGKEDGGYYLEIGAGPPSDGNNTYLFEKKLGWHGVSIDIDPGVVQRWYSLRQNALIVGDATECDYQLILKPFPQVIDYLSLDIDSHYDLVLRKIPFKDYIFKVITIEHDFYRHGDIYRQGEREILTSLGYYLLCPDVIIFFNGRDSIFEDWWIHPSAFPADVLSTLTSLDLKAKRHDRLISSIRDGFGLKQAALQ
jgi:hypothetical protein